MPFAVITPRHSGLKFGSNMIDEVRFCVPKVLECLAYLAFVFDRQNSTNHSGTTVMYGFAKIADVRWNSTNPFLWRHHSFAGTRKVCAVRFAEGLSLPVSWLSSVRSGHLSGRFWTGRAVNSLLVIVSRFTRRASITCREYAPKLCLELLATIKTNVRNQVALSCHERIVSNNVTWHLTKLEVSPLST